jgi:hypothetical protein
MGDMLAGLDEENETEVTRPALLSQGPSPVEYEDQGLLAYSWNYYALRRRNGSIAVVHPRNLYA